MSKREIRSAAAPAPGGTYSQALVAGDLVFTAGMGPIHPETGEVVGADVAAQTRQVPANLAAVPAEAGLDFTEPYPVRTAVGSDLPGILVEIDFVARTRSSWTPVIARVHAALREQSAPRSAQAGV